VTYYTPKPQNINKQNWVVFLERGCHTQWWSL